MLLKAGKPNILRASYSEKEILRALCKKDFFTFVKTFWSVLSSEKPVWNWHVRYLCHKVELMTENLFAGKKKLYDLCVNIPPGSTKSTVLSIMLPAWAWTRMPEFQFIGASYSGDVAMDLSMKTRKVVRSELYRELFPEVDWDTDQDTKHYFMNTAGGWRFAVGVKGDVTSRHAHCLPWESEVETSKGRLPIGFVVDNQLGVTILTFDHATGRTRWQPVERYERHEGKPLCRVEFGDGTFLELTDDHPIYVEGRGYVDPVDLKQGDVVYEANVGRSAVFPLREEVSTLEGEPQVGEARQEVLLERVQLGVEESGKTPLRKVWQTGAPWAQAQVLLRPLSVCDDPGKETPAVDTPCEGFVSRMRQGIQGGPSGVRQVASTPLLEGVRRPGTLAEDEGERKFQLPERRESLSLPSHVCQDEREDQAAGWEGLFPLWQDEGRERRSGGGRPPRRLRQGQQPSGESDVAVQAVPRPPAPEEPAQKVEVRKKVVSRVVPAVRVPEAVYNLQVAEDHNYFADGVLVHNCIVIDDPLNPEESYSDVEIATSNRWIKETLRTRKVSKTRSFSILVMQRLHQDDPTAQFVTGKKVFWVCLPAEVTKDVRPRKLRDKYKRGLLDPIRLPKEVLEEEEAQGAFYYAAQFLQTPVPRGGAMFEVDKMPVRTDRPDHFKALARGWDKAASTDRYAAWTAGVKIGVDKDGGIWVLDVVRFKANTAQREARIMRVARRDGKACRIVLEQEPGSGGKDQAFYGVRNLIGFSVKVVRACKQEGDKANRAEPFSSQVNGGNVYLLKAGWNKDFKDELRYFPASRFKDQTDAASMSFNEVGRPKVRCGVWGRTPVREEILRPLLRGKETRVVKARVLSMRG